MTSKNEDDNEEDDGEISESHWYGVDKAVSDNLRYPEKLNPQIPTQAQYFSKSNYNPHRLISVPRRR